MCIRDRQGAGFVVTKSDEKKETACVEFLKWFTAKEQNTDFSVSAGYVPVTKDALTLENLQAAAESIDGASGNYLVNLCLLYTSGARSGRHPAERLVVARHVPRKRHRRRVVHSRRLS